MPFAELSPQLNAGFIIASLFFVASLALALMRVLRGPTAFDRIVALDLISGLCLGVIILLGIHFHQEVFAEVALIIALVGFLGTVAFSRFLEREGGRKK